MTTSQPLNLDTIEAKAAELRTKIDRKNPWPSDNESHWTAEGWKAGTRNALDKLHPEAMAAEIRRLRARLWEYERPATEAERNALRQSFVELAAQASEDGDHEGAFSLECQLREREEQWAREDAAAHPADAAEPTLLRWGLDDVMWGDDDTVTVLLSGPNGEPYWLELAPERTAVLRQNLAGPDGGDDEPETGTCPCGHDDYHDTHEWADRPGVWCPGISHAADEPAAARP